LFLNVVKQSKSSTHKPLMSSFDERMKFIIFLHTHTHRHTWWTHDLSSLIFIEREK
jgi:hypothetical protein